VNEHLVDAALRVADSAEIDVPGYDRGALAAGVVHISVGGFHRAHQALYFDELAHLGETDWGVVGVGLHRPQMGEVLSDQYGLFTLVERGPDGDQVRVVGSLIGYLFAPDDPGAVVAALTAEQVKLVTLTVTGDGYYTAADGGFDATDPGVLEDLKHPESPCTMVGFLVEALRRRRDSGVGPFTILSCDNLPDSGAAARMAVTSFARLRDADLAQWIEETVTFPSSMVDRITPETSPAVRDEVTAIHGMPDRWPVITEPFRQWVIEDKFCTTRPPLERVGVQFVDDVAPYKLVKSRILNGGHSALGYVGTLLGHEHTDAAMTDPVIREFLELLLHREVRPLLGKVAGIDLDDYVGTTLGRFGNPAIADTLARLCRRGSTKMPSYVLPSLIEARRRGGPWRLLALTVAAWIQYLRGTDLAGRPIDLSDARADELQPLAVRAETDGPRSLLQVHDIFGTLGDDDEVIAQIGEALRMMCQDGFAAALKAAREADDAVSAIDEDKAAPIESVGQNA
jgi:mannitol 2-dehydrogenase